VEAPIHDLRGFVANYFWWALQKQVNLRLKTVRVGTRVCLSENSHQFSAFLTHEDGSVLHAQRGTKIGLKRHWQRIPSAKSQKFQKMRKMGPSE